MFTITSIGISNSNHRYIGLSNLNIIRFIFFLSLRGNAVFWFFSLSAGAEDVLFLFFARRQMPKCCFWSFLAFGRCRGVVFEILCLSVGADDCFFEFSARRRVPKRCFLCFHLIRDLGSTVFYFFSSSEALEEDVYHRFTLTECAARRLCATIFRVTN